MQESVGVKTDLLELSELLSGILKSLLVGIGGTRASLGSCEEQMIRLENKNSVQRWTKTESAIYTLGSVSELRRGLEAERVIHRPGSGGLFWSGMESDRPAEPRVTELPAFLSDVLHEPGASETTGLPGSC